MRKRKRILRCFGLNHFGWFTKVRLNGEDVTEKFKSYVAEHGYMPQNAKSDVLHSDPSWLHTYANAKNICSAFHDYLLNKLLKASPAFLSRRMPGRLFVLPFLRCPVSYYRLKRSDFRQPEINWNDAHHNQANRKGGAYGKNFFYPARKISFRDKPAAPRTFSERI